MLVCPADSSMSDHINYTVFISDLHWSTVYVLWYYVIATNHPNLAHAHSVCTYAWFPEPDWLINPIYIIIQPTSVMRLKFTFC